MKHSREAFAKLSQTKDSSFDARMQQALRNRELLLQYMRIGLGHKSAAKEIGISRDATKRALRALAKQGRVRQVSGPHGPRYEVVE